MASGRFRRPAALIGFIDLMICLAGVLYIQQYQHQAEIEIEVAELEARKSRIEEEIAAAEAEAEIRKAERLEAIDQAVAEAEAEAEAKKAALDARIADVEEMLVQRQDDFQSFDWVVHRFTASRGLPRDPDAHLYLRAKGGIFSDDSSTAMRDSQIVSWLEKKAEDYAASGATDQVLIAAWQENGANDEYIRLLDIRDSHAELIEKVYLYSVILPSGVPAGPK